MNAKKLEDYLHLHIPISHAMGIQVKSASQHEVTLYAPIANNINHKQTVFGGSLHAVATLACWSLLHSNLEDLNPLDLVITHSKVNYLLPVLSDFQAHCQIPEESLWKRFIHTLRLKGKARLTLHANIDQNGKLAVEYEGIFAALKRT